MGTYSWIWAVKGGKLGCVGVRQLAVCSCEDQTSAPCLFLQNDDDDLLMRLTRHDLSHILAHSWVDVMILGIDSRGFLALPRESKLA